MNTTKKIRKNCELLAIALLGKNTAKKWWESPNKAFDLNTPNQQWEIDPQSVYQYLLDASSL